MWFGPWAYRCEMCGETSPEVYSRRVLAEIRRDHRMRAHGGLIPDGEVILQPERFRLADLSTEQRVIGGILVALILLSLAAKIM